MHNKSLVESASASVPLGRRKGANGIDAPYFWPIPALVILANLADGFLSKTLWSFLAAALVMGCSSLSLYTSRRGKFLVWAELLRNLHMRGDERILDLGCFRRAVLLLAAQHLTTGRAVGLDLWRMTDQSGNAAEATRRNTIAEGVADRVDLHTADMTALPFANESFELVVSSIAIHNVQGQAGRNKVIDEAKWVLRPGGRLMVADIIGTSQYHEHLIKLGMLGVDRSSLGWQLCWNGPWMATRLVTAIKSASR